MRRTFRMLAAAVTAAALAVGVGVPAAAAGSSDMALRKALDGVVAGGDAVGARVLVTEHSRTVRLRAGSATLGGRRPVPFEGRYRIGSVTKTFVATVLLQLVAEGKVGLDEPVRRYLPDLLPADKDAITVRMLLHHSSGLADYVSTIPKGADFVRHRFDHYDARELVRRIADRPLVFAPGTDWRYTNVNYVVAGLLIEAVTGRPWGAEVTGRVIRPLGLRATGVPGDVTRVPGPHAHGYERVSPAAGPVDITELNPTVADASGSMISSDADLDRFLTALTGGRLLPARQLAELLPRDGDPVPYGLGIFRVPNSCGVTAWSHTGEIHGYYTLALTTPDRSRRAVVSVTTAAYPLPDDSPVYAAVRKLTDAALCG
ncbi:class A beta-lactamase-related serine hydrolase [Streptomyces luteoverticillatus]|uniref:Class A beta-lactamase-related serine hydrolase n=1 Tax=Streptomyces luteoverticillatus TaxID=66425 RepID=A0A3Q9FTN9_STRLT|nr:serine hydrolase domain-containing protein [Streptomyces luteoverticillatus]AZQ70074.1 class A beta-lactamase-related serine hydrolase [Streptomyces luteoverticillatus]